MLSRLNRNALQDIFGVRLRVIDLPKPESVAMVNARKLLLGYIDGVCKHEIDKIVNCLTRHPVGLVFLDGSNYGALAKIIKRVFPYVVVVTFFHNVEARFFWGNFRRRPAARPLAVLVANYFAERLAVKNSDIIVCLSDRDSQVLARVYGRTASHVSPICVEERSSHARGIVNPCFAKPYVLFVGGGFYGNKDGILWFASNVAPRIPLETVVIGRGLEDLRAKLNSANGVRLVGAVKDLGPWYENAQLVVAPIFDGSGMKTKVAEALMYGKQIVATKEALSGYGAAISHLPSACDTASAFADAIQQLCERSPPKFDVNLRRIYEEEYSFHAAKRRLRNILEPVLPGVEGEVM